jgi:hypothetical protein
MKTYNPFPATPRCAPKVRLCALSREPRVIGIIQSVDVNAPRRKLVGKGKKRVRRIVFK